VLNEGWFGWLKDPLSLRIVLTSRICSRSLTSRWWFPRRVEGERFKRGTKLVATPRVVQTGQIRGCSLRNARSDLGKTRTLAGCGKERWWFQKRSDADYHRRLAHIRSRLDLLGWQHSENEGERDDERIGMKRMTPTVLDGRRGDQWEHSWNSLFCKCWEVVVTLSHQSAVAPACSGLWSLPIKELLDVVFWSSHLW